MNAIIQTIATSDGPFTILADDRQRVLASGWSTDREAIIGRLRASARPLAVRDGETEAAAAVTVYYVGALAAVDVVAVAQSGIALQLSGWTGLRGIRATNVNKRGGRMSAGQRQLISFARAFLADSAVLILSSTRLRHRWTSPRSG